ncbi:retrovirus-related Pol polyprotein from transposon RE1 isoform X3 [Nymphaea colorata]|uniref:retrovirus-related Pol polyprotein from transposon RE1 isoform X3 n=1 Tax=Nymphaea colorata TaxID=210225 RepID=UPI00214E888C|nr:retrovirus-related Pol polyprotein from transposon RE1 isoform X3 [Nymphaea colorata]
MADSPMGEWIIDSGATHHMTGDPKVFHGYKLSSGKERVSLADGSSISAPGKWSLPLLNKFFVHNALHDLVTGKRIGIGLVSDGLYRLPIRVVTALMSAVSRTEKKEEECRQLFLFWHERLGHLPFGILKHLFPELCSSLNISMLSCDVCQFAKHVRASYPISNSRSNKAFSLVHSDVWGPSGIHSRGGFQYFITFIDDYSRCTFVYLLKDRSEVPHIIETFILLVENQYGNSVKTFRSDNAREYLCLTVEEFFRKRGIVHETSCSYTPPQNGVAERKNRQLLNVTRAILFQRNLPKYYWGDAILTSVYLINRMPSRVLKGRTPYSMLPGSSQPFHLPPRVFGCVCFIHNHSPNVKKLDPKSIKGIFLGYSSTKKGYKCLATGRLHITKDVTFLEHVIVSASLYYIFYIKHM